MRLFVLLLLAFLPLPFACPARCQSPDPTVIAADAAYAAKRYADAIPLYRVVMASGLPDDVRARAQFQIGWSFYFLENRKQAQTEWSALADEFSNLPAMACNALLRAGNSAVGTKDLQTAAHYYARAADHYSSVPEAREYAVQARCWLGNVHLRLAEQAKLAVGAAARAQGAEATMDEAWKPCISEYQASEDAYNRVVLDFPEAGKLRAEAEMLLISLHQEYAIYRHDKTQKDVVAEADAFLARWPNDAVRRPTVLMMRAEALHDLSRNDEAIADIGTIQESYSATAKESLGTSQFCLAQCYESKGDIERALKEYRAFLALDAPCFFSSRMHALGQFRIGCCLLYLGRAEEALKELNKVVSLYPDSPVVKDAQTTIDGLADKPTGENS